MFEVPKLPYAYNALEPFIDETTMKIHHDKHHQAYVDKLNAAVAGTEWEKKKIGEIIANLNKVPEEKRAAVRNHGGGHYNHTHFWEIMAPGQHGHPHGEIAEVIDETFGSLDAFKEKFKNAAIGQFGSGWAWLVVSNKKLEIVATPNQDNPLTNGKIPILGVDVWEHSYYLKYQNKRPDYLDAFFNVINWDKVEQNYKQAMK
ncbi:MAG TPA: superoxide dismutase [archaeon]|nr:superoxide dismutase [archaeon]